MSRVPNRVYPNGDTADNIRYFVQYGVLAPSTHNTQPWRFEVDNNVLRITPDHARSLPQADPTTRNLFVSIGACIENIIVAAQAYGYEVTLTDDV